MALPVRPYIEEWKNMASKKFTSLISLRIGLLVANVLLFAWLWYNYQLIFTAVLIGVVIIGQTAELIYFAERMNRELRKFLDAVKYGDYAVSFGSDDLGGTFKELDESFSQIIESMKTSKAEKQSQTELLKLALENIRLGIIIIDFQDNILLVNPAAQNMLNIPHFRNWDMLAKKKPEFARQLGDFSVEGRRLVQLQTATELREYYLDLNHISLLGASYRLISFSDLKNEIEQKEIDAWHKLIRILAHEVMNSVTPVTSLSETIKSMLTDEHGEALPPETLTQEKIDDIILALSTVIRRSQGMLNFVDEYRKLTKLPAPKLELVSVASLLNEVKQLMQIQASKHNVLIEITPMNNRLALQADRKMIEQVLINLIGNAIHAMEDGDNGKIELGANLEDNQLRITIKDDGHGISEDILPSIFIPFFSTRKNGTGIGLTLSKNIMQLHKGGISVSSAEGEGTQFQLSFSI